MLISPFVSFDSDLLDEGVLEEKRREEEGNGFANPKISLNAQIWKAKVGYNAAGQLFSH